MFVGIVGYAATQQTEANGAVVCLPHRLNITRRVAVIDRHPCNEMMQHQIVQHNHPRLAQRAAIDVCVRGRVAEVIQRKVKLCRAIVRVCDDPKL